MIQHNDRLRQIQNLLARSRRTVRINYDHDRILIRQLDCLLMRNENVLISLIAGLQHVDPRADTAVDLTEHNIRRFIDLHCCAANTTQARKESISVI